jgi:hypothetical protein
MGASTDGRLYSNTNPVPVSTINPVTITGVVAANPSGMAVDAFGRSRIALPFTLFRFRINF